MTTGRLRPTHPDPRARPELTEEAARQVVDLVGARVHVDVVVPRTSTRGKMRLLTQGETSLVRAEVRRHLTDNAFPVDTASAGGLGVMDEWNTELGIRTLQRAMRDPANVELDLASLEEWRECDEGQLALLWRQYQDLEAQLDPIGTLDLTDGEVSELEEAAKKKDGDLLMSFGSRKLAAFAISSVARPATSQPPSSGSLP